MKQSLSWQGPYTARRFLQTIYARAYPRVIAQHQRERSWLVFEVFLPMMAVAAYVFVYRAIGAPEEYIGFVIVGGAMMAFWLNILWSMSSQMYWEKEMGNLSLYTIAPTSMMAILLGMAIGGMLATLLRAGSILILGSLIFQVEYQVVSFWQLFVVFLITMVALYGMGMIFASVFLLLNREAWHLAELAQEPIYLLSGFYFPITSVSFWLAAGASIIPLTLGLDAMRQLTFSSGASLGFLSVQVEMLLLIGLCVLFLPIAFFMLRHMERLAVREGRLTDRLG